jgi:hypothetical protein
MRRSRWQPESSVESWCRPAPGVTSRSEQLGAWPHHRAAEVSSGRTGRHAASNAVQVPARAILRCTLRDGANSASPGRSPAIASWARSTNPTQPVLTVDRRATRRGSAAEARIACFRRAAAKSRANSTMPTRIADNRPTAERLCRTTGPPRSAYAGQPAHRGALMPEDRPESGRAQCGGPPREQMCPRRTTGPSRTCPRRRTAPRADVPMPEVRPESRRAQGGHPHGEPARDDPARDGPAQGPTAAAALPEPPAFASYPNRHLWYPICHRAGPQPFESGAALVRTSHSESPRYDCVPRSPSSVPPAFVLDIG